MAAADCGVGTGFVAAANSPAHVTLGPVLGRMGPSWADLLLETDKEAAIAVAAVPRRPGAFTARVTVYAPPSEPVACRIDGLSPATHYDVSAATLSTLALVLRVPAPRSPAQSRRSSSEARRWRRG